MKKWSFSLLFLYSLFHLSTAGDTITPTTAIRDGQTLISSGGFFELGFFSPGSNSNYRYVGIWYKKIPVQTVVWVANRENPLTDSSGALKITNNGSLILYNRAGTVLWSTNSSTTISPVAQLLDSGNFVLKDENDDPGSFIWQSFDYPSDTLLSSMKFGLNLKSGLDRYLTTWKNFDDPSPGDYSFKLDPRGSPEGFIWHRSTRIYRSGPWNGIRFSGVPEMKSSDIFSFDFVDDQDEVYYYYEVKNSSIISRLVLNQSVVQRYVWFNSNQEWSLYWSEPRDQCDTYSECGPYGVCNSNDSPVCHCLKGFYPKSQQDWILRDGSGGCLRGTRLDCEKGDGFLQLTGMKLPDTSSTTEDRSMSLEECREGCLKNCSCMAYASANISGGGSGCIVWGGDLIDLREYVENGQDLYVRAAASDLDTDSTQGNSNKKRTIIIAVVTIACGMLLLGSSGCCIWNKKLKNYGNKKDVRNLLFGSVATTILGPTKDHCSEDGSSKGKELQLPLLDLATIVTSTDNFSVTNKLGEGGFGPVYKGKLGDGQDIAVKRLAKHSLQGTDEFMNEVMLIAKLQHRNLVRLLGCCIHGEERMLIYEYMHNRSLDTYIFDKTKSMFLSWEKRFTIVEGIARGLLYLHQDSRFRIIHRDLKASNILLDKEMIPKISDFGLARIFGGDQADEITKRVVGTYGYMSPEYAMDGIFSEKSDVFSFGVLVLEILSGKKNRGFYYSEPHLNLLSYAWMLWKEGKAWQLLDESMSSSCPISEIMKCIQVGLLCVQERAEDRPLMSSVVLMLGSANAVLPGPKQPGFCNSRSQFDIESSSSYTVNDVTVTMFEGR